MGYDLKRTPAAAPFRAIVTCEKILVCDTHFFHGRTIPCERKHLDPNGQPTAGDCQPCNEAMPFRTHAYVSALQSKTHEHVIFECTAHAAKAFAEYEAAAGTLRGCLFTASRPKQTKNAKVVIETTSANLSQLSLPQPPDLIRALCTIWKIPHTAAPAYPTTQRSDLDTGQSTKARDSFRIDARPLVAMRQQVDNAPTNNEIDERRQELLRGFATPHNGNGHKSPTEPTP